MKKMLSITLTALILMCSASCGSGSSSKLSPEEIFKRQATENAQAYISEKYGFSAKVTNCNPITDETFDFPVDYTPTEDAKVSMKYDNEEFAVIISGKDKTTEGRDSYQYSKISNDAHDFIKNELGDPITTVTLPFQELDSSPTNVFFKSKTEYYDGSNLADMLYPYNFCCIELSDRDLSDESAYKSIIDLFSKTNKYFELCIVSYKDENSYNTHPIYNAYVHEDEKSSCSKLSEDVFKGNSGKINSYRRYFGDGTSEYVTFDEEPASETADSSNVSETETIS